MLTAAGCGYSRWRDRRDDTLARGYDLRRLGLRTSTCATSQRRCLVSGLSTNRTEPDDYESRSTRIVPSSSASDGTSDDRRWTSSSRRETMPRSAHLHIQLPATGRARSMSRPTPNGAGARRADWAHPRSPSCSSRPISAARGAILATARRSPNEPEDGAVHLGGRRRCRRESRESRPTSLASRPQLQRARPRSPYRRRPLSNTSGTVLDPQPCRANACGSARRRGAHRLLDRGRLLPRGDHSTRSTSIASRPPSMRATTLAWTQAQVQRHHLGVASSKPALFQRLAGHLLYANPVTAPAAHRKRSSAGAQPASALWGHGISGDLPIALVRIDDEERTPVRARTPCKPTSIGSGGSSMSTSSSSTRKRPPTSRICRSRSRSFVPGSGQCTQSAFDRAVAARKRFRACAAISSRRTAAMRDPGRSARGSGRPRTRHAGGAA